MGRDATRTASSDGADTLHDRAATTPDLTKGAEEDHLFPSVLPGSQSVLFTIAPVAARWGAGRLSGSGANVRVEVLDLKTGQRRTLIRGASQAEYVDTGHLIYNAAGTLRAVRFDLARLEVLGDPVAVLEQVMTAGSGAANFSVARNGTLAYVPAGAGSQMSGTRSLVWVTRQGREERIVAPLRNYVYPSLSPDGTRAALAIDDEELDIWSWGLYAPRVDARHVRPRPRVVSRVDAGWPAYRLCVGARRRV
jgi:hypothetical protein